MMLEKNLSAPTINVRLSAGRKLMNTCDATECQKSESI
jgi:hypothetical protein